MKTHEFTNVILTDQGPSIMSLPSRIICLFPEIRRLQKRARFRAELRRLLKVGPYMIEDIGLDLEEVQHELSKPLWIEKPIWKIFKLF